MPPGSKTPSWRMVALFIITICDETDETAAHACVWAGVGTGQIAVVGDPVAPEGAGWAPSAVASGLDAAALISSCLLAEGL